jgi:predicted enzyme related to lactoylglutathione lyase
MSRHHHKVDFFELPTVDLGRAKAFYGAVFGWTFEDWGPDYADIQAAGLSGGLRRVSEAPPRGGSLVIVYSDDLDATEGQVQAAGGEITEHHAFPGGRRFHFLDPSGNELAVWTSA